MTTAERSAEGRPAGDRLVRAGIAVTALGMAFTLVAMLPLVTSLELPSGFWWLSMLVGVGLGMVLFGLWRAGSGRSRVQRAAVVSVAGTQVAREAVAGEAVAGEAVAGTVPVTDRGTGS